MVGLLTLSHHIKTRFGLGNPCRLQSASKGPKLALRAEMGQKQPKVRKANPPPPPPPCCGECSPDRMHLKRQLVCNWDIEDQVWRPERHSGPKCLRSGAPKSPLHSLMRKTRILRPQPASLVRLRWTPLPTLRTMQDTCLVVCNDEEVAPGATNWIAAQCRNAFVDLHTDPSLSAAKTRIDLPQPVKDLGQADPSQVTRRI